MKSTKDKNQKTPEHLLKFARDLRQTQTDAETLIWYLIRNRRIFNTKFRRQHPIERYIIDFYCHEHKLAIELDGSQHFEIVTQAKDLERSEYLNSLGISVLRVDNLQVLTETESVLEKIYQELSG